VRLTIVDPLTTEIRTRLSQHADAALAAPMQRYMKSAMPFHGVQTPLRRQLLREVVREHKPHTVERISSACAALWDGAIAREERYCAIDLPQVALGRRAVDLSFLPVWQRFTTEGAWWDFGDAISSPPLGKLLAAFPEMLKPTLRRWATGEDMWLRRAAILAQRGLGESCDAVLLYQCILPSIDSSEFFLRKGIGWALRERGRYAPTEVRTFCAEYHARLSPLTVREGLKHIGAG
jgi:3-methyladenine DNA glycosylase AlkD